MELQEARGREGHSSPGVLQKLNISVVTQKKASDEACRSHRLVCFGTHSTSRALEWYQDKGCVHTALQKASDRVYTANQ